MSGTLSSDDDENMKLIRVHICEKHALSTILRATLTTTAAELCSLLSTKLDIMDVECRFFTLILVHTTIQEKTNRNILYTLKPTDVVIDVLNTINKKHSTCEQLSDTEKDSRNRRSVRWFYKDVRSTQLEIDGEVSGDSSSEDEEECSLSDFAYLKQGERKGFLLKRSSKDPNLWRKRWCVLGDKLLAFSVRNEGKSPSIYILILMVTDYGLYTLSPNISSLTLGSSSYVSCLALVLNS